MSKRPWKFPLGFQALAAGQNSSGELGMNSSQHVVSTFSQVPLPGGISAVACGGSHTLMYDEQRAETYSCGEQDAGGSALSRPVRVLTPLPALRGVRLRALACGLGHSLVITGMISLD
jgi:alpha-tubulin suppressor-like RCC1 family protein